MLAATSPLSAGAVGGDVRRARVLGVFPTAVYLALPSAAGADIVPVVASDALLLPTAVRLPVLSAGLRWGVEIGDVVTVGGNRVGMSALGGIHVVRQWRPARVTHRGGCAPYAAWSPIRSAHFVADRIGRGPGLTPDGDDELCGALLVAHALCVGSNPLRDSVLRVLTRTTSLSASLLRAAGDGYAVPELAAYVDAVLDPAARAATGQESPHVARLAAAVAAIGHSSGAALLRGVDQSIDPQPAVPREPAHA